MARVTGVPGVVALSSVISVLGAASIVGARTVLGMVGVRAVISMANMVVLSRDMLVRRVAVMMPSMRVRVCRRLAACGVVTRIRPGVASSLRR